MTIRQEHVDRYLEGLRPERDEVLAEMEAVGEADRVPIVSWETGRLLASLCRALDPVVLEVGTAIGYSTVHMARALSAGRVVTLERDADRASQARDFFDRAGVADRVELVEGDARETIPTLEGPFGMIFLDASKGEYRQYLELAEPMATDRAVLVVDNLLMSGEVANEPTADGRWSDEALEAARAFNAELLQSDGWLGSVLPIGDGVGVAARMKA